MAGLVATKAQGRNSVRLAVMDKDQLSLPPLQITRRLHMCVLPRPSSCQSALRLITRTTAKLYPSASATI
jgi:hypothetical protein